ncbi:MAG TPA: MFS transporter [Marmoricola sp.]|nr:MFS transporter [Marmoricola sp.]
MSPRGPLRGFLLAEGVSLVGTRVSMIAIPWFVLTTTGSATQTGLVTFAEMAPLVGLKALTGPLVDRVGPRRVAVTADALSVLAVGAVPLLHALGQLGFPLLLVLVAAAGALRGPGDGARNAMVPLLVEHAAVPMERATGLFAAVERSASTLGAAFAGGLVAVVGPANALALDAASFAVSALVLLVATRGLPRFLHAGAGSTAGAGARRPGRSAPGARPRREAYFSELREGWDFLRRDPVLVGICAMVATTNLLDQAYAGLLVPVWGRQSGYGVGAVGLLFAVFSGASIAGAVAASAWSTRLPRFRTYLVAFLLAGAPRFVALALPLPLWSVLAVAVLSGFASGFINPVLGAVVFERIPAPMMGRVTALNSALCWSLIPFGGVVGGALVTAVGLSPTLLLVGAGYLTATMLPALQPRWRELDHRPGTAPAEGRVLQQS